MQISKIKQVKLFSSLFQINNTILNSIKEDIEANGYDSSQPIVIWQGKNLLIDGHTRIMAAQMAGLDDIPVSLKTFGSKDEALSYALHNQRDRRNISDSDLLKIISIIDKRKERKEGNAARAASARKTAKIVGMSARKVNRAKTVLSDKEATKEVMEGKKSINKAAEEVTERKKEEKKYTGSTFNETNENIDWARWSWNPVTGCLAGCKYCYARDIAERFYEQKFKPTFHENRLNAPLNTTPKVIDGIPGKTVFVCSMADLFGDWVPKEWIEKIISVVTETPQWNYLFLTKNPERYLEFSFPTNCWLGATADTQERADKTKEIFYQLKNFSGEYDRKPIKNPLFLSCEPLSECIELIGLAEKIKKSEAPKNAGYILPFDWVIIGGRSANTKMPAFQPKWEWVETILFQARSAGCAIYFKPNLTVRPIEFPGGENPWKRYLV